MSCDCEEGRKRFVAGNGFILSIPLNRRVVSVTGGNVSDEATEFIPTKPVKVVLTCGAKRLEYDPVISGNVAILEFTDGLAVGTYNLDIFTTEDNGMPLRYKEYGAIEIVDATADAGIDAGIEFDVEAHTLEGVVFLSQIGGGGGNGTVTAVKMNDGEPIEPDEDGVVDLGAIVTSINNVTPDENGNINFASGLSATYDTTNERLIFSPDDVMVSGEKLILNS